MILAFAQINPTVGDIGGNTERIIARIEAARQRGADLIALPELAVFGYPPRDLVLRRDLVERNVDAVSRIASHCVGITAVVGFVEPDATGTGKDLCNSAAVCRDGKIVARYRKALLPTYDVFDETRYFRPGTDAVVISVPTDGGAMSVGLTICEDLWNDQQFGGRSVYGADPIARSMAAGAELIVNISASPFVAGKHRVREAIFAEQARRHHVPLVWVNQVGGNDDLLFDGASLMMDEGGRIGARAATFAEALVLVDLDRLDDRLVAAYPDHVESIRQALVVGTRDYVHKCGFEHVVLGLSGGIDSAVTAAVAVQALGPDRVHGVAMPSRFSSDHSLDDADRLARNLGIDHRVIDIEPAHRAMEESMREHFGDGPPGIAEENIQARLRGNILMGLSNKFGWLLLTTGNKSEMAVGYCTLYGDMCGGLAVLCDVPKTTVFALARHLNATWAGPCIPERTISKPPSAELRENQCDQDTLPAYETLDPILERYVEQEQSVERIVAEGFDRATVERVASMVDRNEYKRRQAPVGLKVTSRAFGTGRRVPIAARFR